MTTELTYLALTSLLLASLWIPHVVGINMYGTAELKDFTRPPDKSGLPAWVLRADRAHMNLVEQFGPFAALILLLHVLEVSNGWTVYAAIAFFWLRVAHAVGMITGVAGFPVRPIIFSTAWLSLVILGWQALSVL